MNERSIAEEIPKQLVKRRLYRPSQEWRCRFQRANSLSVIDYENNIKAVALTLFRGTGRRVLGSLLERPREAVEFLVQSTPDLRI